MHRRRWRLALAAGTAVVLTAGFGLGSIPTVSADALSEDFETFNLGSPNGQNGWQFTGPYDVAIADPTAFGVTGMGTRAFRISNATTSGSFSDWAFSEDLQNDAGEPGAAGDGYTGGVRQDRFDASFDLASAVPTALQPDLQFSLAPDRGDGARMSFLRFDDTPTGIEVTFSDYIDAHLLGSAATPADGCGAGDDFENVVIATLDRSITHRVHIAMEFLPGPANDRVFVWIDGELVHVGTSWEDYFRYCETNPTRPVDSLIFQARTSKTAPDTLGEGFLVDNLVLESGPIPAVTATGEWTLYPGQSASYSAQIQQPLNGANTSNWAARSKGAIPVKWGLSTQAGPVVFESIGTNNPAITSDDYSFLRFAPDPSLRFAEIQELMAGYAFSLGNCHGGSLRWQVGTALGNLQIYYGDVPNFTDCTTNDQSDLNMIGWSDVRYDTSQIGGTFYDTYAHALTLIGEQPITYAMLVLDSGWGGDQRLTPSNVTVNDNVFVPEPAGEPTTTCDLSPTAYIEVVKLSPDANGAINEEPVQASLVDDGNVYRVVDCKYQFNLSIPSLKGAGHYRIEIQIPQGTVIGQVEFDLK